MGRTRGPMRGPATLELAHGEGGQQRARGAEEDAGEGIGQPVRPRVRIFEIARAAATMTTAR